MFWHVVTPYLIHLEIAAESHILPGCLTSLSPLLGHTWTTLQRRVGRWLVAATRPIAHTTAGTSVLDITRSKRIRGELLKLGIKVRKHTIQKHFRGVRPLRGGGQKWSTFLQNNAYQTWACDFLQTHDLLFRTIFVFVIIELNCKLVLHAGVIRSPTDQ